MTPNLNVSIHTLPETKIIGKRMKMSFAQNETRALWQSFMPHKKTISNAIGDDLYSVEVYPGLSFFSKFDMTTPFEKWAGMIVTDFDNIPAGMETLIIPRGDYAVFFYKGKASDAPPFFQYIFGQWLPSSPYSLDDRPHFALMSDKYKNEDDESEEEIWIPIKEKNT